VQQNIPIRISIMLTRFWACDIYAELFWDRRNQAPWPQSLHHEVKMLYQKMQYLGGYWRMME